MTGLPRVFSVSSSEMIEAFEEVSTRILEAIHGVLERTPPELVADISTNGICMTGGGSLVWGFDKLIESHTGIETHVAGRRHLLRGLRHWQESGRRGLHAGRHHQPLPQKADELKNKTGTPGRLAGRAVLRCIAAQPSRSRASPTVKMSPALR